MLCSVRARCDSSVLVIEIIFLDAWLRRSIECRGGVCNDKKGSQIGTLGRASLIWANLLRYGLHLVAREQFKKMRILQSDAR